MFELFHVRWEAVRIWPILMWFHKILWGENTDRRHLKETALGRSRLGYHDVSVYGKWLGYHDVSVYGKWQWQYKELGSCDCFTCVSFFNAGHVARMGEERGAYRVLVGKPEGKRPLGRLRRRWVDNIRMDLQEVGCGYVDWIGLAQDRDRRQTLVNAVMNLRVP